MKTGNECYARNFNTSVTITATTANIHSTDPTATAIIDQCFALLEANTALSKSPLS